MSDWFFMVGEPLSRTSSARCTNTCAGSTSTTQLPIELILDWQSAGRAIANPEWDRRWWDAEQHEKNRLYAKAKAELGESELCNRCRAPFNRPTRFMEPQRCEAARRGCADPALIRVAAGAASQALHLAALARLAGEGDAHPFSIKAALFAGGHWPLGIVNGCYCVF